MSADEQFMERAIALAKQGIRGVSPNPMVGCVIVHEDRIIGEGYHQQFGGPHAEVNALNAVEDPSLLGQSTAYITLEPCAHHGKTPPCADLLVEKGIGKVVIGSRDPFERVDGRGIEILHQAQISVQMGCLEEACTEMNRRFFTTVEKKRPYIVLKWAQTADGLVARTNYDSKWISNQYSRQLVHKWRAEEDAILVGKNTALHDNPALDVRDWEGDNPVRIILDPRLELPRHLQVFDGSVKTLVFNEDRSVEGACELVKYDGTLEDMLYQLVERNVGSILVEGGSQMLTSFLEADLWDEARIFYTDVTFGKGISAPNISGRVTDSLDVMGDTLRIFRNDY